MAKKQKKSNKKVTAKAFAISFSYLRKPFYVLGILIISLGLVMYKGTAKETDSTTQPLYRLQANVKAHIRQEKRVPVIAVPLETLTSESYYIVDIPSGDAIATNNELVERYPASTTKVITALVALQEFGPESVLEVKREFTEGQTAKFVVGERLTLENILHALLIHSANDAAYLIADNYPGGYDSFIAAMNTYATKLGMTNTHFLNPAGLDQDGHHSSAYDMSLAGRAFLKNPFLKKNRRYQKYYYLRCHLLLLSSLVQCQSVTGSDPRDSRAQDGIHRAGWGKPDHLLSTG
ncbi:MAG: D-alanyl-D-alanine carboxypeptidase DacB precursor [Microgenomates bacterium OLB22]|nr:MAG: D-alanyl-D-alanine carboxypeptidase DacB precursor [Microgenomates bacterium OLB22]